MRRALAILLAAGALIAGCGESDERAQPAATSTPAPAQDDRGAYGY